MERVHGAIEKSDGGDRDPLLARLRLEWHGFDRCRLVVADN
jgi:hypothetical protein